MSIWAFALAVATSVVVPAFVPIVTGGVTCDRLNVVYSRAGDVLTVSLDTDLPDFTDITVSVSRSYLRQGDTNECEIQYFQEMSTVGEWRKPHKVSVAHEQFTHLLREQQENEYRIDVGAPVARISENVRISVIVPSYQSNPAFGNLNENLSGAATYSTGFSRQAKSEVFVHYPLPQTKAPNSRHVEKHLIL